MEVNGQLHTPASLPPGKDPSGPIRQEAGWATESVWTRWKREKFPSPAGNQTLAFWYGLCSVSRSIIFKDKLKIVITDSLVMASETKR